MQIVLFYVLDGEMFIVNGIAPCYVKMLRIRIWLSERNKDPKKRKGWAYSLPTTLN